MGFDPSPWQFLQQNQRGCPVLNPRKMAVSDQIASCDLHPVTWCQYYDGGRFWVTTLGHDGAAFTDGSGFPGQVGFKQMVVNGIKSAWG